MDISAIIPSGIFILNFIFIILLIFFERKDPSATWAWLLILTLIPVAGFVLYLFLGLTPRKKRAFQRKQEIDNVQKVIFAENSTSLAEADSDFDHLEEGIIRLALKNKNPALVGYNKVQIYTNGSDKFADLFNDIRNAEKYIHLNYYIIDDDQLSEEFLDLLVEKAKEGLEVRLLYDRMGCRNISKHHLNILEDAGGKAVPFAPFVLDINYRNHRKNVVIDGQIGYIGGMNVANEYIGKSDKFGDWRDTHLRIKGESVDSLQHRFLLDWNFATSRNIIDQKKYFPPKKEKGSSAVQIVSSGPDSKEEEIKALFLKMIYGAEQNIFIQTPYFIPDQAMLEALQVASRSGVDVRIMIPDRSDHPFVYAANNSFVGQMLESGARCYRYTRGFLHSKTISVDGRITSIGTTNMDVRSFKLNFEINAFIYDREVTNLHEDIFRNDLKNSIEITQELYENRGWSMKVRESISRLISPIL
ncbi:MAG: cardiolipin synthase [Bacillota bacterium]